MPQKATQTLGYRSEARSRSSLGISGRDFAKISCHQRKEKHPPNACLQNAAALFRPPYAGERMSETIRVSVVIPVHTATASVASTVHSALASDLHELEIVVVDNSPAHSSASVTDNIRDPRVVAVRLRPGRGAARARNVGIVRARAPYVAFLEPDDLVKPAKLSAAADALDRHPDAGFAFADFEECDAHGHVVRPSAMADFHGFRALAVVALDDGWRLIAKEQLARGLLSEDFIGTSGVVVRKRLLTEIGPFDESTTHCEDLDLWFRLAHHCDAVYWDRVGHTRRTSASVGSDSDARTTDRITVLQRERKRWSDRAALRQLDRRVAENLAIMGYEQRLRRRRLRSAAMFAYAFATFPDMRWFNGMLGALVLPQSRDAA
jgi:glycosyltransferase involved in cell wall biosynthesis